MENKEGRSLSAFYKQTKRINVKQWNKLFKIKVNGGVSKYAYKLPPNESKSSNWLV